MDDSAIGDALSLFAAHLARRRFGGEALLVLEAALAAGADVAALLATRSAARRLLRSRAAEVLPEAAKKQDERLTVADFFARAFALVGDVESCLVMRYEVLVLRETKYSKDHDLQVSHEEWLTFAKDSLDNGFYTIASKAFENALMHIQPSNSGEQDCNSSMLQNHNINDVKGLCDMAKSLAASRSIQTQSAEYMKRKALRADERCNSRPEKPRMLGSSMFRLGINTRNVRKLHSKQQVVASSRSDQACSNLPSCNLQQHGDG